MNVMELAMKLLFQVLMVGIVATAFAVDFATAADEIKTRTVRLNYGATLKQLPAGANIRVWLPVPQDTEHQQVERLHSTLPTEVTLTTEPKYGNRMLYFEQSAAPSGMLSFRTAYRITRHES